MLKLLGWIVKLAAFSALVLVLGNLVHWHGKTISDQVKSHLAHAEAMPATAFNHVRHLANGWVGQAREAAGEGTGVSVYKTKATAEAAAKDEFAPSERAKLRDLIRDLNQSH